MTRPPVSIGVIALALLVALCLAGCERDAVTYSESKYGPFTDDEYTEWMTRSDLQMFIDTYDRSEKRIFRSEGRNYKGLSQYRYALRKRPDNVVASWVRSGRSADAFRSLGVKYQRDGYERVSLQLFRDSSGMTRYQAVWFKYKDKEGQKTGTDK